MADPLSITASVISILRLTETVIHYLLDVKGAGKDRDTILTEITSTHSFLFLLQGKAEKSGAQWDERFFQTMKALNGPKGPLEQFKLALEQLAIKLTPVTGLKKLGKALAWPFESKEIKNILSKIERQKSLFLLALQNDHM